MKKSKAKPGDVILISGPPGAGKSAAARELVKLLDGPAAYIEGDVFWGFLAKTAGRSRRSDAKPLIRAMMLSALAFSKSGYTVVVDFSIGPWHVDLFKDWLGDAKVHYIIVCPSVRVCAQRAAVRSDGAIVDYAPYRDLYDAFARGHAFEKNLIRDDDAEPCAIATKIAQSSRSGDYCI